MSMSDSDVGKVFVGGISRDTNDATLKQHFSKYGEVTSSIVAIDRVTGLPRGFGFVTFSNPSSLHLALSHQHLIAGRPVSSLFPFSFFLFIHIAFCILSFSLFKRWSLENSLFIFFNY